MKALSEVKSECLKGCANAFAANMERTLIFAMLPTEIAFQVRRDTAFQLNAQFRVIGKGETSLEELMTFKFTPAIDKEFGEQMKEHNALSLEDSSQFRCHPRLPKSRGAGFPCAVPYCSFPAEVRL